MKTKDAISYFGSETQLAKALGIKSPSIYSWGETVPDLRQIQLEMITSGQLKAESRLKPLPKAA